MRIFAEHISAAEPRTYFAAIEFASKQPSPIL